MTKKKVTVAMIKRIMRNKLGREKYYSDILDPDRSDVELKVYYQCVLSRYALPTYIPSLPLVSTGKMASCFTKNVRGLIIWKHMHGIVWVLNTLLNIEKNPKDVANF